MSVMREFAASAGSQNVMMAGRVSLFEAFEENLATVTAATPASAVADAGPQSMLEALTSFVTDRGVEEKIADKTAPAQQDVPTYKEVANKIADVKVENLRHVATPSNDRISTSVPADRNANDYALRSTTEKLGAVNQIEQDLNKIAFAEAAGRPPAQEPAVETNTDPAMQGGLGGIARSAVTGGIVTAGITAAFGPVAGAVVGGAMALGDVKSLAGMVAGARANGAGTFAGDTGSSGRYEKMTKAEARSESLRSEGNSPAQNSFAAVAKAAPAPVAPKPELADVETVSNSLEGVSKLKVQESPQLMAMRQDVERMKSVLTLQNSDARDLKNVFDDRGQKGVQLNAESVLEAHERGMQITNAAGRLSLNGMVA